MGGLENERTYTLKAVEVLGAIGTDGLDSHQASVRQPSAGAGYPHCDGGTIRRFGGTAVGNPIAPGEKATPRGNLLKPI